MHIQIDTASIGQTEIRGLIVLLSTLLGDSVPPAVNSVNNLTPQAPVSSEVPAETQLTQPTPSPVTAVTDSPTTETPKRTRRTKAEMEAAEKGSADKAQAPADPTTASAADTSSAAVPAVASGTTQSATASKSTVSAAVTADELRALLNGYIAKYSMEAAIDQLKAFGCNRVTEALALEPAKLSALAAALNG